MNLKISTLQTQKQILAPVMQQSISVLMLSITELGISIEQELQSNPMLEPEPISVKNKKSDQPVFQSSFRQLSDSSHLHSTNEDDEQREIQIIQKESLEDHLMRQLRIEFKNSVQRKIGELIIGNLNEDGFLTTTIDEIAWLGKISELNLVENVLKKIQTFDPIGIASRDIKECLLIQMEASSSTYATTARKILLNHFDDFFKKKFDKIAKSLNMKAESVVQAAEYISSLEPKPARDYRSSEQTIYVQPDVFVSKDHEGHLHIEVNKSDIPGVRINPQYMKLLKTPNLSTDERKFIEEKMNSAINFIKSIQQRGETLLNIAQYIVEHQKDFFSGNTGQLSPMALKDIAVFLHRNESTISRAIHNKFIQTPVGMYKLHHFFSHAVNDANKDVSSHNIKEEMVGLIESEDKKNPLSDQEIIQHFESKGIKMARRTINKYRLELDIAPSHKRKKL
jgi:RNA polymerase sigma-54 factor